MMKRESALVVALCLVGGGVLLSYAISSRQQRGSDAGVPAPSISETNPGVVVEGKVELESEGRRWTEEFGVVRSAAGVLEELGHSVTSFETWLQHGDSGLVLLPRLVDAQPFEGGGVRTVTTVQSNHPELIPKGVFEYQHSTGDDLSDSIRKGFEQWAQIDLLVLLDAFRREPETCTVLEWSFPTEDGDPERIRRVLLGPVAHFVLESPSEEDADGETQEEHPFCLCCLFTNTMDSFESFLESDDFCAIRFYAARDQNGDPMADCRVNGEDWEEGARALRGYVETWPQRGVEFRKQYVAVQTVKERTGGNETDTEAEPAAQRNPGDRES